MSSDIPFIVSRVPGPNSLELAGRLGRVESPDTTYLSADFPVFWESAHGCLVTDVDGNRYLDATSSFGALSVGHTHPNIVAAVQRQSEALIHGMGDVHPSRVKVELLERIALYSPIPDPRIILGQSGAEAVEAALKTAYLATNRPGVLAFEGGYHGLSYGALEPTARAMFREPFARQRGRFTTHLPYGCSAEILRDAFANAETEIGAVIVEPIQGRGGIRVPPADWLQSVHEICSENGALLILDEIYTGWGRTGKLFACEWEDCVPDLLCSGKAMGGGMPISACVGRRDLIEQAWPKSTGEALHTSTFLGHPLACAGAIAAIDTIVGEDLPALALSRGQYLLTRLSDLAVRYPQYIVEARGRGLMIGLKLRSRDLALHLMLDSLRHGLIVLLAGDGGDVVELTPPLLITEAQIDWIVNALALHFANL